MRAGRRLELHVADLCRAAGWTVTTPARISGARTSHDIDVWAEFQVQDLAITMAIECRERKERVKKDQVAAFREIVNDIGANIGIMVSTAGFQIGARQAAEHSNVLLRTEDEFERERARGLARQSASRTISQRRLDIIRAINRLTDREKVVLTLYYFEALTISEIAAVLGVANSRVAYIRKAAVAHMGETLLGNDQD
jgi:RNA polymerase sigma factor (sigma-70 family)